MSVQEIQVGPSQGKVGLKRKLTGPPRLLLGKFKAKNQGDVQVEGQAGRQNGVSDGKEAERGSPRNQRDTTTGDGSIDAATESIPKPGAEATETQCGQTAAMASGSRSSTKESAVDGECPDGGTAGKGRAEKRTRRRFWTPSLVCIQRKRHRVERGVDNTFLDVTNDGSAVDAAGDSTHANEDCEAFTSNCCRDTDSGGNGRSLVRAWSTVKRLLTTSGNRRQRTVARTENAIQSGCGDKPRPKVSLRKKMGRLFKRDSKKGFITAVDEGVRASLVEETARMSDTPPPAGQEALAVVEGGCLEANAKVRSCCSETLTVSVEVSALGREGIEEADPVKSDDGADVSGSLSGVRTTGKECRSRGCSEDEAEKADRRLKSDHASKPTGGLAPVMEETTSIERDFDWPPGGQPDAHSDQINDPGSRPPVNVAVFESDGIPDDAHTDDRVGQGHSYGATPQQSGAEDPPDLNTRVPNGIDCIQHHGRERAAVDTDAVITNGLTDSPLEDLPVGDTPSPTDLPRGGPDQRCHEALLVKAATSLVQQAMKAALDQLAAEMEAMAASVNQGAQAYQSHL